MRQELLTKKKELVEFFLKNGILLSNDILTKLDEDIDTSALKELIKKINTQDLLILNTDIAEYLSNKGLLQEKYPVKIMSSYTTELKKWAPEDFIEHFNIRFKTLERLLRKRQELTSLTSINRLMHKREKESICIIGMVLNRDFTKNNNLVLTLEDTTGQIKVIVNRNKPQLFEDALTIVPDEVIAIQGVASNGVVFANNILWPDIPNNKELKKAKDECYVLFLSDLHIGSKYFLAEEFMKFIKWLNLELGDETQISIAEKIGYIFIIGDIVDGCGVYPSQEEDLAIKDVKLQYKECARLLSMVPAHIKIIICPGNHDAMRLTEPQLPIYKDFAEDIYKLPNIILVSNPALVNIHANDSEGFNVLLYHGVSFDYYVANVDFIRNNGGYDSIDLIMKFLLRRRHLAPTHSSTSYIPDPGYDPLIIETLPDIFATGHVHKSVFTNYKGITLIGGSCWQSLTEYQKRHGHKPEPCRVPVINLQTRHGRIIRFTK